MVHVASLPGLYPSFYRMQWFLHSPAIIPDAVHVHSLDRTNRPSLELDPSAVDSELSMSSGRKLDSTSAGMMGESGSEDWASVSSGISNSSRSSRIGGGVRALGSLRGMLTGGLNPALRGLCGTDCLSPPLESRPLEGRLRLDSED